MLNKTGYNFGLRTNYTVKKKEVENKEQKNEVQKQVDNKTNAKQTTQAKPLANANEILAQQNLSMISWNKPNGAVSVSAGVIKTPEKPETQEEQKPEGPIVTAGTIKMPEKQEEPKGPITTAGTIKMPEAQEEPKGPITTAGTIKMPEAQEEPKGPIITAGTIKMPESNNQNKETFIGPKVEGNENEETFIGPKVEGNTTDNINNSVPEPTPMHPGNQMKTSMTFEKHMTNVLKERLKAENYDLSKVDFEDMVNYIKENAADNQISNLSYLIDKYVKENNISSTFEQLILNSNKIEQGGNKNIVNEVKDKFDEAFEKMKNDDKNIADKVKDKFDEAFEKMKNDDKNIADKVKDKFDEAFEKMKKDDNTNTKNTAKDTINKGIEYNGLINNNKDINGIYKQTPTNTLGNFRTKLDRNEFLR